MACKFANPFGTVCCFECKKECEDRCKGMPKAVSYTHLTLPTIA